MQPLFLCDSYDFSLCVFFLLVSSPSFLNTTSLRLAYSRLVYAIWT